MAEDQDQAVEEPKTETPAEEEAPEAADPNKIEVLPKNDPSRKTAERTASTLSYQNLILKSYLEQQFKINPHVTVRFRTLSAGLMEFIFRRISHSHREEWASIFDEALRQHYTAASLQEFNENSIGPDLDEAFRKGEEAAGEALEERVQYIKGLPSVMANLLYAHYVLFTERVDDFIKNGGEDLGNS